MTHDENRGPAEPTESGRRLLGMPADWRRPTTTRAKARTWNPDEPRLFPPKSFGVGWTINFYWLLHPLRYLRRRR